MKISGMHKIKSDLREESRKQTNGIRREESSHTSRVGLGSSTNKRGNNIKKYIFAVVFLIFSLLLATIVVNWRSVNRVIEAFDISNPVNNKVINAEKSEDEIDRMLLVITKGETDSDSRVEKVYSLSHNPQKGDRIVLYIPGGVYIPLANSEIAPYSSISNLHYAGETIKPGLGITYAIWELEEYIGYEFDSYLWLENAATEGFEENMGVTDEDDPEEYFSKVVAISNPFYLVLKGEKILNVSDSFYSNLDSREVLNELSKYSMNAFSNVQFIDFSQSDYIVKEALPTGDEVPFLDQSAVDDVIRQIGVEMLDKEIEKEQTKIEVYNGSDISGLGGRFSRYLMNNGLNVIRVDNADTQIEKTRIYVPQKEKYEKSLNMVVGLIPMEVEIIEDRPNFLTTGDIIVILGQNNESEIEWMLKDDN